MCSKNTVPKKDSIFRTHNNTNICSLVVTPCDIVEYNVIPKWRYSQVFNSTNLW